MPSDNGPRFKLLVTLADTEDTNEDGDPYIYRSSEAITESEVRRTEYIELAESPAWQLAERILPQFQERNPDLGGDSDAE